MRGNTYSYAEYFHVKKSQQKLNKLISQDRITHTKEVVSLIPTALHLKNQSQLVQ